MTQMEMDNAMKSKMCCSWNLLEMVFRAGRQKTMLVTASGYMFRDWTGRLDMVNTLMAAKLESFILGEFFSTTGSLQTATQSDGWMIFDADYFNTPISNGHVDLEGSLTSPFLDFSAESNMVVEWVSYFRYCCFPYAPLFLDVGVTEDGQTIWTEFDGYGDFIEASNTASPNPYPVEVDISCAAAHKDSVQIRFAYRQAEEFGNSYSHYYWGIDDVYVRRNVVEHDVVVSELILANNQDMNVFSAPGNIPQFLWVWQKALAREGSM